MQTDREELLRELQSVASGLSAREIVEQSTCFVFKRGRVYTYNDEVTCRRKSVLSDLEGAVQSDALINILAKLPDKLVTVRAEDKKGATRLVVIGKRRKATLRMESEINLPVNSVKIPKTWNDLPPKFIEALQMVRGCTADESSDFGLSCIHCTPEFIEACDRMQAARVAIQIGLPGSILVRKESINHIIPLAVSKWALTRTWIHFRNDDDLIISCRRYSAEEYRDLSPIYAGTDGSKVRLSDGLLEIGNRASILNNEHLKIRLDRGKIMISSSSVVGRYVEFATLQGYSGSGNTFFIAPDTLKYIIKEHKTVRITSKRIMARGPHFVYVASITPAGK